MVSGTCSLSIMVARTDIPFMMHTIPHIVRMCNFPFTQRLLAVDTAPLSGDKVNRPGVGTMEQLRNYCDQLLAAGVVDKVVDIDYSPDYQKRIYQKHFGTRIRQSHNYKGYPILGTIFSIEEVPGDYVVHFDSDMLIHQQPDYSWIEEGIKLLQNHPDVMSVRPLTGPPKDDGEINQRVSYERDPQGFYKFKFFSSRVYLSDRKRFDSLLPLPIFWRTYKNKVLNGLPISLKTQLNYLTGKGQLDSWEVMVSNRLEETSYVRAVLDSPKAWTVHPKNREPEFIKALPKLIERIEKGWYPPEQAGYYDLIFEHWL
ncbi:glycosyltransferase family A protein [Coleofasciculus sp. G2-EDA-02]|uniref:glycosyltransferase family A protein n=1 Tax=Coleofasciculus sp. G2-EDA-02 TaxID=3069529 RepID=UPI0032F5A120